jgi:hypothetical protein
MILVFFVFSFLLIALNRDVDLNSINQKLDTKN